MLVYQGFPQLSSMVQLCLSLLPLQSSLQWAWQTHPISTTSNISPVMDSMLMAQVEDQSSVTMCWNDAEQYAMSHYTKFCTGEFILGCGVKAWGASNTKVGHSSASPVTLQSLSLLSCPSPLRSLAPLYSTPHPPDPAFDDLSQAHGEYSKGGYGGSAQSQGKSAGSGPGKGTHLF